MTLLFQRIGEHDLPLPRRHTQGSAGYDLPCSIKFRLNPSEMRAVSTGWAVQLPPYTVGLVRGRSGSAFGKGVWAFEGTIDEDFRGELCVLLYNFSSIPHVFEKGDRIGQLVVVPYIGQPGYEVQQLRDSDRGTSGYGSTGA